MRPVNVRRERGAALLALLAVIALGASWFLVSQLNAESGGIAAVKRNRNAEALNRAKLALIGYVASQAAEAGERNPGRLPCPEGAAYVGDPGNEGIAWSGFGTDCASIGRLPWRTLGLEKLLDASSEPLWYVVGPTWRLASSTSTLTINSNTIGDISVDSQNVVALIVAPGPAINVQAGAGCTAKNQVRTTPSSTIDPTNYLECFDAATLQFTTTASSTSYNDQIVRITVADIMPAIEAAIANRIEREIVPSLKTVYANAQWGAGISATNPLFPYPAPFGNPGTSNFQGAAVTVAGAPQGLLPFNQTQGCNPATDARCTTTLTAWSSPSPAPPPDVTKTGGFGYFQTKTCSWQSSGEVALCQGEYHEDDLNPSGSGMVISMTATINNVAMGLRILDTTKATIEAEDDVLIGTLTTITPSIAATMNSNGSVTITFSGTLPNIDVKGWGTYANYRIRLERSVISDHALLSSSDPTTGWFVRNEWYRLLYYAAAQGHMAAQLPFPSGSACTTTGSNCLTVTNTTPPDNKKALLILAGRSITGATRPNGTLSDFVEFDNADLNTVFERQPTSKSIDAALKKPFNDRIIVLDAN